MYQENFFFHAFVYLAAAVISVPLAKRFGLGSVLGYLLAGIVIGPDGFGLIGSEGQDVMHFAEFGVVMMLFLIGLELKPSLLWRMRGPILGLGGLQVCVTTVIIGAICLAFDLTIRTSLAIGMILSLSSTAIVLQTLNEKGLIRTDAGQSAFSVLLFQDIAVIPMLAVLPLLATGAHTNATGADLNHGGHLWVDGLAGWEKALVISGVICAIIAAGLFLVRPVFRAVAGTNLREIFTAAALLLVIGIGLLMSKVGISPALGTFLAGVVLANSEYRHELEGDLEPFKGLLLGLFFISVGASVDFGMIGSNPFLIGLMVIGLILVKLAVLTPLGWIFRMGADQNVLFSFSLAQGGEFAFVLFSFAVQNNVISNTLANPLISAVVLSMTFTPLLMIVNEKWIQPSFGTKEKGESEPDVIDEQNRIIIAGFGNFGSVLGRLLRANGVGITVLDIDSDKVELLRKLGLKVFYGNAARHDLLHAAGAQEAKAMIIAVHDHETALQIIQVVRKHFPHLSIFARSTGRTQTYELLDAGVEHVYRETLDTSLKAGVDVLRLLGFRSYQAHRATKTFRLHDEESLRELRHLRHDRKIYLSHARKKIEDLEQLLLSELEDSEEHVDAGWDTTSMIREFGSHQEREEKQADS